MATTLGIVYMTGCSYEVAYDLLSQSTTNNTSSVRLYGILHVSNNQISWSRGTASVYNTTWGIGTYYSRGDYTLVSEDATIYHDNNGYASVWVGGSLSTTFVSGSTGGTMTLPKINRYPILNSGSNFTDEGNPVFNITAYNTFPVRVKLECGGNTSFITRDLGTIGSRTYTLELTNAERDRLRALIPNSNSLKVRETVCAMSGNTELSYSYKDYTMTIVNGNPVFSNFDFEDINQTTLALTGDNQKCIKGYSTIKATITSTDKAQAVKSATMNKYRFAIGDASTDINYSDENDVAGVIRNAQNGTFNVFATDSRNNSTLITKLATQEIAYEPIYFDKQNCKVERNDNRVGDNAILTINGTFWNDSFGEETNSIVSTTYKFKKTNSDTWINGTTTITPTITDNKFSFSGMIASDNQDTSWDLDASYNVEVIIEDELTITTVDLILNSAVPTLSLDKEGVGILCAYNNTIGGKLQIGGDIYIVDENGNAQKLSNLDVFSTEEHIVGTWINNKPIYRKVISMGNLANTAGKSVNHGISNLDKTIRIMGIADNGTTYVLGAGFNDEIYWSKVSVVWNTKTNRTSFTAYVIMEYTKTTD